MSDWENEDSEPVVQVPIVKPGQWEGEDAEEEDVKDSWDASEDEEEKKPKEKPAVNSPKPKQKKKLAQKLAERKALEQQDEDPYANETPEERKQREEKSIRESDLENAKELFGVSSSAGKGGASFLDTMKPSNKAEFDEFAALLVQRLELHSKSAFFGSFVETLARDLCVSLSVDDCKKISATVTAVANEKLKASKSSGKKKAPAKKAVLKAGPSGADLTNYDDVIHVPNSNPQVYDDFDDFIFELIALETVTGIWHSLLEQPVFGVIRDCCIIRRSFHQQRNESDLLATTSDSGYLSFISVLDHTDIYGIPKALRFETVSQIQIAAPGLDYTDLGHKLAVDHLSRAVVVSSFKNLFQVVPLKEGLPNNERSQKIVEEGSIWSVEFVKTSADSKVAFLVLSVIESKSAMFLYEEGDSKSYLKKYQIQLESDDLCLNIVSLNLPSFMLTISVIDLLGVCAELFKESDIVLINISDPSRSVASKFLLAPLHETISRSVGFSFNGEEVPLVSSIQISNYMLPNSLLHPVYVGFDNGGLVIVSFSLETLEMEILAVFHRSPIADISLISLSGCKEYVALVGDMCDGEVIEVDFQIQKISQLGSISNWAPTIDFKISDQPDGSQFFFSTGGRGESGGILNKFQRGVLIEPFYTLSDPISKGIWPVLILGLGDVLILSFICETRVLVVNSDEILDISDDSGLDLKVATVFGGSVDGIDATLLQIHEKGVKISQSLHAADDDISAFKQCKWSTSENEIVTSGTQLGGKIILFTAITRTILIFDIVLEPFLNIVQISSIACEDDISCMFASSLLLSDKSVDVA
ncbi:hypothetical protein HDU97_003684 [Phlyctochytrium planicorne]|nr:hypothetical protein HDU97_003684 [Phlyctochytrium planicorne]